MLQGYLELKLSWQLFQKAPETLSELERNRLLEVARKQNSIEQRILASAAAANVVVPAATLATRVAEVRKRYPSEDEFAQDLENAAASTRRRWARRRNATCASKACSKKSPRLPRR